MPPHLSRMKAAGRADSLEKPAAKGKYGSESIAEIP